MWRLKLLESLHLNCSDCELHTNRYKLVFGEGTHTSDIVWVVEAPGRNENIQGIPLVGNAGQLLRKFMIDAHLESISYITNIVKCWPGMTNPNPSQSCVDICRPMLIKQLDIIKPKVIVAVGKVALSWFLRKSPKEITITPYIDKTITYKNIPVYVIYHPNYIARNRTNRIIFTNYWKSFKQIRSLAKGK